MTNTQIISTEYHMNQPSVFSIIDGNYYGCMIYPSSRNFPKPGYWASTTGSDSDRYFKVTDVNYSEDEIIQIKKLQTVIDSLEAIIPNQPRWDIEYPVPSLFSFKIKRGVAYNAYKVASEKRSGAISDYFKSIEKYEAAKYQAQRELRKILLKNAN